MEHQLKNGQKMKKLYPLLILGFTSAYLSAAEFTPNRYDVYIGDLNNDGFADYYFHGKNQFVLLHGDVITPLLIAGTPSYSIYREGNGYSPAAALKLTDAQLMNMITLGKLRLATASNSGLGISTDVLYWRDNLNGFTSVLLRGADNYAPALLLASGSADLPLVAAIYAYETGKPNFSDRSFSFSLQDVNADGRADVVVNAQVYLSNYNGLLSDKPYNLNQVSGPVTENFFYDDLGRLIRMESSDGVVQSYTLDAEDNRRQSGEVKGVD